MKKQHEVEAVQFQNKKLTIRVDGKEHEFELSAISEKLADASEIERQKYEISPSGYGIHWALIDEDLSIDGLLGIQHSALNIKKPFKFESIHTDSVVLNWLPLHAPDHLHTRRATHCGVVPDKAELPMLLK